MHLHPGGKRGEEGVLILIEGAIAAQRNAEEQIPVAADDVDERVDDEGRCLVFVGIEQRA